MINKFICSIVMFFMMLSVTGCFSPMVYNQSKQKVALRKAIIANNQPAIQAIRLGDNGVGLGVNVFAMEALGEQPFKQIVAAIGDAILAWAGYEGIGWVKENVIEDGTKEKAGGGNSSDNGGNTYTITVHVEGDNNVINAGNSEKNDNSDTNTD